MTVTSTLRPWTLVWTRGALAELPASTTRTFSRELLAGRGGTRNEKEYVPLMSCHLLSVARQAWNATRSPFAACAQSASTPA